MIKPSPKQLRFIDEYMVDLNGKQACIRAGYSEKTAAEQATRLLTKAHIVTEIQKRQAKLRVKTEVTTEYVVNSLQTVAERCMGDKLDSSGANRSLELLGKHVGAFEKDNSQKKTDVEIILEQIAEKAENALRGIKEWSLTNG